MPILVTTVYLQIWDMGVLITAMQSRGIAHRCAIRYNVEIYKPPSGQHARWRPSLCRLQDRALDLRGPVPIKKTSNFLVRSCVEVTMDLDLFSIPVQFTREFSFAAVATVVVRPPCGKCTLSSSRSCLTALRRFRFIPVSSCSFRSPRAVPISARKSAGSQTR